MGKIIKKQIQGMNWWMKLSLVLFLTLATTMFMYEGWYKPKPAQAAITTLQNETNVYTSTALPGASVVSFPVGGTAGSRMLVVMYTIEGSSSGVAAATSVTYGGQSLTLAGGDGGTSLSMHTMIYYLKDNAVMDGTNKTLAFNGATFAGTLTKANVWYAIYNGVDQAATPVVRNYNSGATGVTTAAFASALSIPANGQAVLAVSCARAGAAVTYTPAANWTIDNQIATGTTGKGLVATRSIPATATNDTVSSTLTTARISMTGMSMAPAVATDSTPPTAGTVTVSPDVNSTYTSAAPIITTTFTDAESAVSSCQYTTNNGTTWLAGTVSGSAPYTCTASPTGLTGFLNINMRATSSGGTTTATLIQRTVDSTNPSDGALTVIKGDTLNNLMWSAASETGGSGGIANYKLVYNVGSTVPPLYCAGGTQYGGTIPATTLSISHTGLVNGTLYSYRLCAIDNFGNTSGGSTGTATPSTDQSLIKSCGKCHGYKAPDTFADGTSRNDAGKFQGSHNNHVIAGAIDCVVCHTVPAGETTAYNKHANGTVNIQGSIAGGTYGGGSFAATNTFTPSTCSGTTCHGSNSPTWGSNTTNATCTKCHGVLNTTPAQYTADNKTAAPGYSGGRDTGGATVPTDAQVGAHAAHLNAASNYSNPIACTECHANVNPTSASFTGHMNGAGNVDFGTTAKLNSTIPSYSAGSCSTTYCHFGNPSGTYSPAPAVSWTNTALLNGTLTLTGDCGKCHLSPPSTTGSHVGITTLAQCNGCHDNVTPAGTFTDKSKHINGTVEGGCTGCHGWPQTTNAHTIHIDNIIAEKALGGLPGGFVNNQVCGVCHNVSALTKHAGTVGNDGTSRNIYLPTPSVLQASYQFGANPVSYDKGGTTTCSNISCHLGGGTTPAWGTPPTSTCQSCHGYPPVTTASDPDNKHFGTAVNHIGVGATVNTKETFVSVHGGCQICHGTQDNGSGSQAPHANYNVTTDHFTGSLNMNGPTTAPTTTSTRYDATIRGCLNACHGSTGQYQMTAANKTLAYGAYGAGGDCISCHTTAQGTRSAVVGEFGLAWGHKKSTRGAVTVADCIVCHLEGDFATQSPSAKHKNGNIDLRDPDVQGETAITDLNNAAWTFTKFSISYAAGSRSSTAANDIPNILTRKFCLKCHDANGATNTTARSGAGTQYMPFGGVNLGANYTVANGSAAAGGVVNVNAQFATTNSSVHPVLGPRNADFPTAARLADPYKPTGTRGTSGTRTQGVIMNCFDCHNAPTPLTTRTIAAHGNAVTLRGVPATTGTPSATNEATLCNTCHLTYRSTTGLHGTGTAWSSGSNGTHTAFVEFGCNKCHASAYDTATVRPVRALDVHGVNALPTGGLTKTGRWNVAGARPYAFIRNTQQLTNHQPRMIGTTSYTAQCSGMGGTTCNDGSRTGNYTLGGTY